MSISSPPAAAKLRLLSSSTIPHQPLIPLRSKRTHLSAPKASVSNGNLQFAVASTSLSTVDGSELTSTVGSPVQLNQWNLGPKHISLLNVTACAVAISASWLFFSAIPTLLAFRKAANSLEKLLEVTAEELPDTMAAVRLSGMEISDLTTELSDLGQEITQGVRSSTRAVRVAEDRIRGIATMTPKVSVQGQEGRMKKMEEPRAVKTARALREGVLKGRAAFGAIFSFIGFSRWAFGSLSRAGNKNQRKKKK